LEDRTSLRKNILNIPEAEKMDSQPNDGDLGSLEKWIMSIELWGKSVGIPLHRY
jgi:hypothetical protein